MNNSRPMTARFLALAFVSAAKEGGISVADLETVAELALAGILRLDEKAGETRSDRGLLAKRSEVLNEFREALQTFAEREGVIG